MFFLIDSFRVVVGYDDLVHTTTTGKNIILLHGQSWTFECRYKLNSGGIIDSTVLGEPGLNDPLVLVKEIQFEFNYYSDYTYNEVLFQFFLTYNI